MVKVIDTSYHKGYIDWEKVKATGVEGVILKATDGFFMPDNMEGTSWTGHEDPSFRLYWKQLKDLFKWRGAYHFLRMDDEIAVQKGRPTSLQQVELFHNTVTREGLEWNDYIILDIEQAASQLDYLSKATVGQRIKDAVTLTEELFGRKPMIYTGAWWWEMYHYYIDKSFISNYPFWLSHYWHIDSQNELVYNGYYFYERSNRLFPIEWRGENNLNKRIAYCRLPSIGGVPTINPDKVYMWQYSESGNIDGITSKVDLNKYIIDETLWEEARGEEPTSPPPPDPEDPCEDCMTALEYILEVLEKLVAFIKGLLGG